MQEAVVSLKDPEHSQGRWQDVAKLLLWPGVQRFTAEGRLRQAHGLQRRELLQIGYSLPRVGVCVNGEVPERELRRREGSNDIGSLIHIG